MFYEYSDEEFKNLVKYHYKNEYNFNKDFEERILAIEDILIYQQILIRVNEENIRFANEIETKKNIQLDNKIESYNEKNIDFLKDKLICNIKNIIAYRFFKDNYNNILLNLKEMNSFINSTKETILSKESLDIYNKIINMDNMTSEQLISLYNEFKIIAINIEANSNDNGDLSTLYYDDYRKCIDKSHELIFDSLTDFDEDIDSTLIDNKFAVHELKGQPFGILITCGSIKPFFKKINSNQEKKDDPWSLFAGNIGGRFNDTASSLSYLDENFIKSNWHGTVIGFRKKDINPNQIIAVNPYDLDAGSSGFNIPELKYTNTIVTPQDLSRRTSVRGHNEITYRCKSNDIIYENDELNQSLAPLIPAYIVCYNEITQKEIDIAKEIEDEFGVKLEFILIHEEKYEKSIHYETEEEQQQRNSKYILKEY